MRYFKSILSKCWLILYKIRARKLNSIILSWCFETDLLVGCYVNIGKKVKIGSKVKIGDFTYLNSDNYWITIESNVEIGKYCSIAPGVVIGSGNHEVSFVTTHPILFNSYYEKLLGYPVGRILFFGLKDKDVETRIGNDVWIGISSIIKRGVRIGNGAVIASGSVVVKDVPDYAVVGGNPARIIKYRTSEENIDMIRDSEEIMWWNQNSEYLFENINCMYDFDKYKQLLTEKHKKTNLVKR